MPFIPALNRFRRYPLVRQYDEQDCAPAALLSVLRFHGGDTSLVHVRSLCQTDGRGTRMSDLVWAAQYLGFNATGARGSYADLLTEQLPCIAHVILENHFHHYVIVYKMTPHKVLVGDPAKGRKWIRKEDFLSLWRKRSVVLLSPRSTLFSTPQKSWISWIRPYLSQQSAWIEQVVFLGLCCTALNMAPTLGIQLLLDRFIPRQSSGMILWTGLLVAGLLLCKSGLGFIRSRFLIFLNRRLSTRIATDFFEHLFFLPKSFFDSRKTGDITSRLEDSLKIQEAVLLLVNSLAIDGLLVFGSLGLMFYFFAQGALLTSLFAVLYAILIWSLTRSIRKKQYRTMQTHADLRSIYIDTIQGQDTLAAFNGQPWAVEKNRHLFIQFQSAVQDLGMTQARLGSFAEAAGGLLLTGLLTFSAIRVSNSELATGRLIAVYSLISFLLPSIHSLVNATVSLEGARVAAQRLMDLLLTETESKSGVLLESIKSGIRLEDVTFAYPKSPALFNRLNLRLSPGTLYGIWGANGSGKSTLISLLQSRYRPLSGRIQIDQIPSDRVSPDSIRERLATVDHQNKIFDGTLAENILCGRSASHLAELGQKLAPFGLDTFALRFPEGWLTPIGESDRRLSGGERQLLGLCRALYDHPDILIIDEGFSAVDVETREFIFGVVRQYACDHLVLLISHDINLLMRTDYLIHLERNGITEQGFSTDLFKQEDSHFSRILKNHSPVFHEKPDPNSQPSAEIKTRKRVTFANNPPMNGCLQMKGAPGSDVNPAVCDTSNDPSIGAC